MPSQFSCRLRSGAVALLAALAALIAPAAATAAGPPVLGATWATDVVASSARLWVTVTPNGFATAYHFEYLEDADYEANLLAGKDPFAGARKAPAGPDPSVGSGTAPVTLSQPLSGLVADIPYRYRAVAKNSAGPATGPAFAFATRSFASGSTLLDDRAWEMVSPVDKNGGAVAAPGALAGGGVLQAAAGGGAVTYGSASSFGPGAEGAPPASQYISRRDAGGWSTENVTTPILSGSYGDDPLGVPYQLFSTDLARGLLLNGRHCRDGGSDCPVANPPPPGTAAPGGYQNYYLRESATGAFRALLGAGDLAATTLTAAELDLAFAAASPDLGHIVLASCAALTADATEVPDGEGCDAEEPNLYAWNQVGLGLVNLLPGDNQGTPGAALAAPNGAISADGNRVYFVQAGDLYLRDGNVTKQVDAAAGGGGTFQAAASDGSVAFFTKGKALWRYGAAGDSADEVAAGVDGVLGISDDGSYLYYLGGAGLLLRHGAETREVAAAADAGNYPPATGGARVSADGTRLAFAAETPLATSSGTYDNTDRDSGEPDSQIYLYDADADRLICVSCNPTNARPIGPSSIPGADANGALPGSPRPYKSRALSADGRRLFFDSADALVLADTNKAPDAYEWEAEGTGSCTKAGGCLALISSGRGEGGASFVDASADGTDVFFLTERSLVGSDPGSVDLYDARVGGGFPDPPTPIPCEGDACQVLPSEPEDPAVTTLIPGPGNPPLRYTYRHRPKKQAKKHRKGDRKAKHGKAKDGKRGGRR